VDFMEMRNGPITKHFSKRGAARYENYSDFEHGRWQICRTHKGKAFSIRGSVAQDRAPSFAQLYYNSTFDFVCRAAIDKKIISGITVPLRALEIPELKKRKNHLTSAAGLPLKSNRLH
jgi:hypothetical protein